jgi:predicted nucleotidyltransferase
MEEQLKALLQALQRYQPQRIILFGSAARGEADAESDLDVLVIKETPAPFVKRLETMVEAAQAIVALANLISAMSWYTAAGNPFLTYPQRMTGRPKAGSQVGVITPPPHPPSPGGRGG